MQTKILWDQIPSGAAPTQGWGTIDGTGEAVYFRYRGQRASLAIAASDTSTFGPTDENCLCYRMHRIPQTDGDCMGTEEAIALAETWVEDYLRDKERKEVNIQ